MTSSQQERAITKELVEALRRELGPAFKPEAPTEADGEKTREVFTRIFDKHRIVIEAVGWRIRERVKRLLAKAERDRQLDAARLQKESSDK